MFRCSGASVAVWIPHSKGTTIYSHMRRDVGKSFPGVKLRDQTLPSSGWHWVCFTWPWQG